MKRMIPFEKFEASGNDFIIFDFFEFDLFDLDDKNFIKMLCDRHFGIGADGLIALQKEDKLDFHMQYFNSDGNSSSFCGNGSRASILYMASKQSKTEFGFSAHDGFHEGRVRNNLVSVKMKNIPGIEETPQGKVIDSGSPHLIVEVTDPWEFPVNDEGRRLRELFGKKGVNVNFVSKKDTKIRIATYERGVEWETLACGTGVTASAYYFGLKNQDSGHHTLEVEAKGGDLSVSMNLFDNKATDIWLTGGARKVFSGFYEI